MLRVELRVTQQQQQQHYGKWKMSNSGPNEDDATTTATEDDAAADVAHPIRDPPMSLNAIDSTGVVAGVWFAFVKNWRKWLQNEDDDARMPQRFNLTVYC
jgi:hypothetical protein